MKFKLKFFAIISGGVFLFFLDRIIKLYIDQFPFFSIKIFDWFQIEQAYNYGIAFGVPFNFWLLIILYIFILTALIVGSVINVKQKNLFSFGALFLIIMGAFSNLLDRIRFGYVIDYLYLKNFSIFNIADVMITVGAILYLYSNYVKRKK